jgi:hypothetical protein
MTGGRVFPWVAGDSEASARSALDNWLPLCALLRDLSTTGSTKDISVVPLGFYALFCANCRTTATSPDNLRDLSYDLVLRKRTYCVGPSLCALLRDRPYD